MSLTIMRLISLQKVKIILTLHFVAQKFKVNRNYDEHHVYDMVVYLISFIQISKYSCLGCVEDD